MFVFVQEDSEMPPMETETLSFQGKMKTLGEKKNDQRCFRLLCKHKSVK